MAQILDQLKLLLRITRSRSILRRYFVVNGFDGALTMLGMITGFYTGGETSPKVMISACLGATIALGMSGLSSAYVSEAAERRKELKDLESAMMTDLGEAAHGRAARLVPVFIALTNGLAPLLIALTIISPLWILPLLGPWFLAPLQLSILLAFSIIFLLGILLGKVSGTFWLFSGLRTLFIGVLTCLIIYLFSPG